MSQRLQLYFLYTFATCLLANAKNTIHCPSTDSGEETRALNSRQLQAQWEEEGELQKVVSCKQKAVQAVTAVAYWPHMQWAISSWIVKPGQLFATCHPVGEEKSRDRSINRTDSNLGVELKPKTKGLCSRARPESKTGAGGRRKAAAGQVSSSLRLTWLVLGGYFHNVGNINTNANTNKDKNCEIQRSERRPNLVLFAQSQTQIHFLELMTLVK